MNILLAEDPKYGKNAGSKARIDVERILEAEGFKHITLYRSSNRILIAIDTIKALIQSAILTNKGDFLIIEHPYGNYLFYANIISRFSWALRKLKDINTVVIVHDIESIRYRGLSIFKEIRCLNRYKYIVCHNPRMKEFLRSNHATTHILCLGFFDYLTNLTDDSSTNNNDIIIAGNLSREKSGYIYQFNDGFPYHIKLYGVGVTESDLPACESYMGAYDPNILPGIIRGKWGLVWDGDSLETCHGLMGEYLRYNNPHKASMYITAGIPLIVWKESAIADYVIEYNIGIIINSLCDLPQIISDVPECEYLQMKHNIVKLQKELTAGGHLKRVLNEAQKYSRENI